MDVRDINGEPPAAVKLFRLIIGSRGTLSSLLVCCLKTPTWQSLR